MRAIAAPDFFTKGNLDATQVLVLPDAAKAQIFAALATDFYINPAYTLPKGLCEAALEIVKHVRSSAKNTGIISLSELGECAAQILTSKSAAFTGAERALAATVCLHVSGKSPVTARMINSTNDVYQGAYIANITNALTAAVKEGDLTQESGDGHGKFAVTDAGLARIRYLWFKLPNTERETPPQKLTELAA